LYFLATHYKWIVELWRFLLFLLSLVATENYKNTPFSDFLIFSFALWRNFANKKSLELLASSVELLPQ